MSNLPDLPQGYTFSDEPPLPQGYRFDDGTVDSGWVGPFLQGVGRGANKRKLGIQQVGSDVARWMTGDMGSEYSPYRKLIDEEANKEILASKNAPFSGKAGEALYSAAEGMAVPYGRTMGLGKRTLLNIGENAALGYTQAARSPEERTGNAVAGATVGTLAPATMGIIGSVATKGGRIAGSAVSEKFRDADAVRAAAATIEQELGPRAGNGQSFSPPGGSGFGGGGRWPQLPGVNPTAAMLWQQPEILRLEKNARVRSGEQFLARDIENTKAVWDALRQRTYGSQAVPEGGHEGQMNYLNDLANAVTTPMRDQAIKTARRGLLEDAGLFLRGKSDGLLTDLETRSDASAKTLGKYVNDTLDSHPTVDAYDVYNIRKNLADRLRSSNPLEIDALTNAAKSGRKHAVDLIDAADTGLNSASIGQWKNYLDTHSGLMKQVDEAKAMGKVLDEFGVSPTLPDNPSYPLVTRAKLDRAVDNNTWNHLGKQGYVDRLSPETRGLLSEAQDVTQAMEHAKGGSATLAINGSQTTPNALAAMKNGLRSLGNSKGMGWAINLADTLGTSQGQRALDDALLNPEKLKAVLDAYDHGAIGIEYSPMIQAIKRSFRAVPTVGGLL